MCNVDCGILETLEMLGATEEQIDFCYDYMVKAPIDGNSEWCVMDALLNEYSVPDMIDILEDGNFEMYEGYRNIVEYYVYEVLEKDYNESQYFDYYNGAMKYQEQHPELTFCFQEFYKICVVVY